MENNSAACPLRQKSAPFRPFITWDIHYACNYRCSYCYLNADFSKNQKKNRYPGLLHWKKIWDDFYDRYGSAHIHISGGEPSIYPDFIEFTRYLTEKHTVEFDTNLSFDAVEFVRKVLPGRVKFCSTFHPENTDSRDFIDRFKLLRSRCFDIAVSCVAYPPFYDAISRFRCELARALAPNKPDLHIIPYRGTYNGREYPAAYSEEEKKWMYSLDDENAAKNQAFYGSVPAPMIHGPLPEPSVERAEKVTVNPLARSDGADMAQPPVCENASSLNPHYGNICRMGHVYSKIHPDGNAYRCCLIVDQGALGNIIEGSFSLYDEPRACYHDKCSCWVAMVPGEEDRWVGHWVLPKYLGHLTFDPSDEFVRERESITLLVQSRDHEAALKRAAELVAEHPLQTDFLELQAETLLRAGRLEQADTVIGTALRMIRFSHNAVRIAGEIMKARCLESSTLASLLEAGADEHAHPNDRARALYAAAIMCRDTQQFDDSSRHIRKAVDLCGEDTEIARAAALMVPDRLDQLRRARTAREAKDYPLAIEILSRLSALSDDDNEARILYAETLYIARHLDDAYRIIREVLDRGSANHWAERLAGEIETARGDDSAAQEHFLRVINAQGVGSPDLAWASYRLGEIKERAGDIRGAFELMKRSGELLPDEQYIKEGIARISALIGLSVM